MFHLLGYNYIFLSGLHGKPNHSQLSDGLLISGTWKNLLAKSAGLAVHQFLRRGLREWARIYPPLPLPAAASVALGRAVAVGTDKSTAVVTPLFSPRAVIRRDRPLLRVREEFVVPEPSLSPSAGTTDDGAHCYGRVCIACPRQPN